MSKETNKESQRRGMMLTTPIARLVLKMAVPTMVAMVADSVYSMTDTYFVSSLGTAATAAVGVNASIDQAIMMAGSFLGIGGGSYISRLLGAKQPEKASNTLSAAFFSALFMGLLITVPGLIFIEPLVTFLGATEASRQYSIDYASFVLMAAPLIAASFVLNHCLRSEGSPVFAMMGILVGAVVNIALDPILIFSLELGITGAGIATAISKTLSLCILLFPYLKRKSVLRLSIKAVKFSRDIVREITLIGMPSLLRMGLAVVCFILMNNLAGQYSDSALAGISVVVKIMMVPVFATLGFAQGFTPVAGFNWGSKRFDRVRSSFKFASYAAVGGMLLFCAPIVIFAEPVISLFTEADAELIEIGKLALISQCILMPFNAYVMVTNMLYSALGKPVGAIVLGITRQGLCFIPMFLFLPSIFGIFGLALTQAAADVLSFLVVIPFAVYAGRFIRRTQGDELPLPDASSGEI